MDLKGLLNQTLNSDIVKQGSSALQQGASGLGNMTKDKSNLTALGAGAVGGGLIGMLMGSKKARKMGKKAAGIGGAAALGALAFKVYNDWQSNQNSQAQPAPQAELPNSNQLDENQHSVLILKAMIAAAKADGHVDAEETAKIEQAIASMGADSSVSQLVSAELAKPLDPAEVARSVSGPEQAAEVYLASLLVADEQNFMEKAYLKELANQLGLAGDLVAQLEAQVNG